MKKYQNGFTLIEIVVVLSVVFILAAFLAPYVPPFIEKVKILKLQKDIETIEIGLTIFNVDTGSYPPDDDPEPTDQCGEVSDRDLVGDVFIEGGENQVEGDSGLLYNAGKKHGWHGPYLDPKNPPQKSVIGGSILYKIGDFGDFFHTKRKDIALIFTVCPGTTGYEEIFRGLDQKLDQGNGAKKGFVSVENAANDDDFSSGNLRVIIIPDGI